MTIYYRSARGGWTTTLPPKPNLLDEKFILTLAGRLPTSWLFCQWCDWFYDSTDKIFIEPFSSSRRSNLLFLEQPYRPTRGSEVDLAALIDCFWRASGVMTSCRLLSHTFCTVWTSYLGSSDAKTRGMDSNLSYHIGIEYRGTLTRTQSLWKDFPVFTSRLLHLQTGWLLWNQAVQG